MKMQDFFNFRSKLLSKAIQAHPINLSIDHVSLIKGNFEKFEFPIIFKQEYGKIFYDILDTGYPGFYLISNRMKIILEENKLTGWKVFPIKLYDKKNTEIFDYHGFSVIGKCGPTSFDKSTIIEKRSSPNAPICRYYKGMLFDKWDGSDFFTPEGTYETLITKKAAEVLKNHKISHMYLINLDDYEFNIDYIID